MAAGGIISPNKLDLGLERTEQAKQWSDWIEELELFFSADDITNDKRKYSLLLYLGDIELRTVYETLDDEEKTFKSAKAALNTYFAEKKNVVFERYIFNTEKQKEEENYKSYLVRIKKLGMSCNFDEYTLEDALIDKFIPGCKDSSLPKILLGIKNITLDKLLEKTVSHQTISN